MNYEAWNIFVMKLCRAFPSNNIFKIFHACNNFVHQSTPALSTRFTEVSPIVSDPQRLSEILWVRWVDKGGQQQSLLF